MLNKRESGESRSSGEEWGLDIMKLGTLIGFSQN